MRKETGGGAAVLVSKDLHCTRATEFEVPDLELLWFRVTDVRINLLIGTIYASTWDNASFSKLGWSLMKIPLELRKNILLLRDFNEPDIN